MVAIYLSVLGKANNFTILSIQFPQCRSGRIIYSNHLNSDYINQEVADTHFHVLLNTSAINCLVCVLFRHFFSVYFVIFKNRMLHSNVKCKNFDLSNSMVNNIWGVRYQSKIAWKYWVAVNLKMAYFLLLSASTQFIILQIFWDRLTFFNYF